MRHAGSKAREQEASQRRSSFARSCASAFFRFRAGDEALIAWFMARLVFRFSIPLLVLMVSSAVGGAALSNPSASRFDRSSGSR